MISPAALVADLESALPQIWGRRVHSIFIGGGTPSLISPDGLDELLTAIRMRVQLDPMAEITLEANPGTVDAGRFKAFRQAGVNRLSVGIQSFDEHHLQALGRIHGRADAIAAAEAALTHFEAVNLDLMYALPGQTLAQAEADLATALALSACSHTPHQPPQPKAQAAMPSTHTVVSRYSFNDTVSRLENAITSRGMTVFAVIDHQATARQSGLNMQPAKVIIFGTPKAGTPLMAKDPAFALQLPLRVLVTENSGQVQVVFNDTRALISGSNIGYAEVENTLAGAEKLIRHTVSE